MKPEFLERTEVFSDRCVAVAEQLAADRRFGRIVEQLVASGSSVGANLAEADEAMSVKDFRKCLAIATKEPAETRFWLRLCVRRNWLPESRLSPLLAELSELKAITGAILKETRVPSQIRQVRPIIKRCPLPAPSSESPETSDLAI